MRKLKILSKASARTRRPGRRSGQLSISLGLGCFGVALLAMGCNTKKERKGVTVSPTQSAAPNPETDPTNTGGSGGGAGGAGAIGDRSGSSSYFSPRPRPANITLPNGQTRPVNPSDIFVTAVHVKTEAWFRTCVTVASGPNPLGIGCSLAKAQPLPPEDMPELTVDRPIGIPFEKGGQKIALNFESFKSAVVKCSDPTARQSSTTEFCPGSLDSVPFATRSSSSAAKAIKCAKSDGIFVIFYEDQDDSMIDKNNSYRSGLKSISGVSPLLPNLRDIFSDPPLTTSYVESTQGQTVTELDVRKKFGVDFQDVILQVDLGSAGNTISGLDSCQ